MSTTDQHDATRRAFEEAPDPEHELGFAKAAEDNERIGAISKRERRAMHRGLLKRLANEARKEVQP